jgi:hypothetical protein
MQMNDIKPELNELAKRICETENKEAIIVIAPILPNEDEWFYGFHIKTIDSREMEMCENIIGMMDEFFNNPDLVYEWMQKKYPDKDMSYVKDEVIKIRDRRK